MDTSVNQSSFLKRFIRNRSAVLGSILLSLILIVAALASLIFPASPFEMVGKPLQAPFGEYLLGTDRLGRDVAAGVAYGARTSIMIALIATGISVFFGTLVGSIAGYYGSRVDNVLMRLTEFFQTIPSFVFAIVLVAIMQPSIISIVTAIAVVTWPPVARLVRGEFIAMRNREFVQACICIGMRDSAIIFREILPNVLSPILVTGSLMVATAILIESALAFLGLGDPNVMSWGFMIGSGREFLRTAWWLCAIPGVAILLTVLSINLVGEGLNDTLNPRLRNL
jgi:peptide/nickel transport system permease protein